MRVTQKYLVEVLESEIHRLELNVEVLGIHKTFCRRHEYEAGAAHWVFQCMNGDYPFTIYIFYPIQYMQQELSRGYELYLQFRNEKWLHDAELNLRLKK